MERRVVPPERIDAGAVVLRRVSPDDAEAMAAAIEESLDHLRPWMPWASGPEPASVEGRRAWLSGPAGSWKEGGEYHFAILRDGALVGICGLNRRAGPGALDIGYWVHAGHTRKGIATAAAAALTGAGFGLEGVERMEIHCDRANAASAGVAAKVGYRKAGTIEVPPQAPSETGARDVWVMERPAWEARR